MTSNSSTVSTLEKPIYRDERPDVEGLVPADARRVLDVGCGAGRLGAALKRRSSQVEVVGVEMSPALADAAREVLDEVRVGTIEEVISDLPDGSFDCIVVSDVLEHLVNPHQVLADLRPKLAGPDAVVVASIPNVRHKRVVRELLLRGRWDYDASGLMDSGHLRFFTLDSIYKMFAWAGYRAELSAVNRVALRKRWLSRRFLGAPLTAFVDHQYLVTARPLPGASGPAEPWWSTARSL